MQQTALATSVQCLHSAKVGRCVTRRVSTIATSYAPLIKPSGRGDVDNGGRENSATL